MADEFKHKTIPDLILHYPEDWLDIGAHLFDSQASRDILYASSATQLSRLGAGNRGLGAATITVAASDSSAGHKALADYVCDGTADEVQIQAAIDALPVTGGTVQLTEGTFTLPNRINLSSLCVLRGSGRHITTLVAAANNLHGLLRATTKTDITVKDLSIDGVSATYNDNYGTWFDNITRLLIDNVGCYNNAIQGIYILGVTGLSSHFQVINCYCEGNGHRGIIADPRVQYGVIANNVLSANGYSGINLGHGAYDIAVTGNVIETTDTNHGINVNYDAARITITGNVIRSVNQNGIMLNGHIIDSIITGNTISDCGESGIVMRGAAQDGTYVWQTEGNTERNVITGNVISLCGEDGIRFSDTGEGYEARRAIIVGNFIYGNTAWGIYQVDDTAYNTIAYNHIISNGDGVISPTSTTDIVRGNLGWVTENSGISSIDSGQTTKVVAHGLAVTPTIINIAFREQGTNDFGRWWVSTIGATNFTLNVSADPGASNLDFAWEAKVR